MLLIIIGLFIAAAFFFVHYLIVKDRGHKEPIGALWGAFGFGVLGMVAALIIEPLVVSKSIVDQTAGLPLSQVAVGALLIGLIEESCKFIPLAFFIYHKRYFDEHTDGVLYFAIAGLGFGLPENIFYSLGYGAGVGVTRLVMTVLFHSATTALAGYYLARHKLDRTPLWTVVAALVTAMLLHALYDFGLMSRLTGLVLLSLAITFGLSVNLFVLLRRSSKADVLAGLSSEGNNAFCRHCGAPNPKHMLYCARCGNRA